MNKNWEVSELDNTNFHSSRKERHELSGFDENRKKRGFFKNNPSFKIIIIDLIFIVIISGVIVPFIYKREGTSRIDNYKLVLKAFDYDDVTMVTLTVSELDEIDSEGLIEADFYFDKDSSHNIESDILPGSGEKRILKTSLQSNEEIYVYCDITINSVNKTIKKKIK